MTMQEGEDRIAAEVHLVAVEEEREALLVEPEELHAELGGEVRRREVEEGVEEGVEVELLHRRGGRRMTAMKRVSYVSSGYRPG